jgi:hypothetical protein
LYRISAMAAIAAGGSGASGGATAPAEPLMEFLTNFEVLQLVQNREVARKKALVAGGAPPANKELIWLEKQVKKYFRNLSKLEHLSEAAINSFISALQASEPEIGIQFMPGEILQLINHVPSNAMQLQAVMDPCRIVDSDVDILTPEQEEVILSLVDEHLLGNTQ